MAHSSLPIIIGQPLKPSYTAHPRPHTTTFCHVPPPYARVVLGFILLCPFRPPFPTAVVTRPNLSHVRSAPRPPSLQIRTCPGERALASPNWPFCKSEPSPFTSADRFWFLLHASRLKHWKDALVLLQPKTLPLLGSVQRECLDHFLIWSKRQLYRVVREYISYLNRARRHQGLKQQIPENIPREDTAPASNKIILFPELKEKDREGRRSTAPAAEAHRRGGAGEDHCIPGVELVPS